MPKENNKKRNYTLNGLFSTGCLTSFFTRTLLPNCSEGLCYAAGVSSLGTGWFFLGALVVINWSDIKRYTKNIFLCERSDKQFHKDPDLLEAIKKSEKIKTDLEELSKYGFNFETIPTAFLEPMTDIIMTCPVSYAIGNACITIDYETMKKNLDENDFVLRIPFFPCPPFHVNKNLQNWLENWIQQKLEFLEAPVDEVIAEQAWPSNVTNSY